MIFKIKSADNNNLNEVIKLKKELLEIQSTFSQDKNKFLKKIENAENLIKEYFSKSYSYFFLAKVDNEFVGFILYTIDPNPKFEINSYIQDLYVKKEFRRLKIATRLLEKVIDLSKEKNKIVGVTTDFNNKCAINFYEKHNFKIIKKEKNIVYLKLIK